MPSSGAFGRRFCLERRLQAGRLRSIRDVHVFAALTDALSSTMLRQMTTATEVRIPEGLHSVTPYLAGEGAAKLIDFMERAFGAKVEARYPRPDDPEKIMHSQILIGDSRIELGDVENVADARRFELHLYVDDADAVYEKAVAAGARSLHAPTDQPYGDREAGIEDPMGNYWYIATHGKEVRPEGFRGSRRSSTRVMRRSSSTS